MTAGRLLAVSRPPDRLGAHLVLTAVVLLVLVGLYLLMLRGWRRRARRHGDLPALPATPLLPSRPLLPALAGLYAGSTVAGDWLDRITAHGLGERGRGRLRLVEDGVIVERAGREPFLVPGRALESATVEPALAGKVVGAGGLLVLRWRHGGLLLDTGFRGDSPERHDQWAATITRLKEEPLPDPLASAPPLVGRARPPAILVLEDGRSFAGDAYGARGETFGEAVFNTGMTGYQETLTDPSYYRQVVTMTAPHIGNTGVNDEDPESRRIWVAGYVVREPARRPSNWRSQRTLDEELAAAGVVGISGIDTRALTRHLRERGAMRVGVSSVETDPQALLARVLESPSMEGADLAPEVTTPQAYVVPAQGERRFRVAAVDLGIKAMTPRLMARQGCEVHVLPATATAAELLAVGPDGVFFSNGPGDPAAADYAVAAMRGVLDAGTPVFGICFGNQILGRALGMGTYKLKYGHRGVNQPVRDRTGRVHITSHNHGFAVDAPREGTADTAYGRVEVSHIDLNDDVVEGLHCLDVPAFSVQYHPEAAPGPHDAGGLFEDFAALMTAGGRP